MPAPNHTDVERRADTTAAKPGDIGTIVVSTLLLILAVAALWQSWNFSALGAIFPRVICSVLIIVSVITLWRALSRRSSPSRGLPRDGILRGLLLIAVMSLWIAVLETAGFAVAGVAAYLALAVITEREPLTWRRMIRFILVAVAIVVAFQLVFVYGLKVQLPTGTMF